MNSTPRLACIFLAAGHSTRFGSNKLLATFRGQPLIETIFSSFPCECFQHTTVVTRYSQVAKSAIQHGFSVTRLTCAESTLSQSIQRGILSLPDGLEGCLFSVCDQPLLHPQTILRMVAAFHANPHAIVAVSWQGQRGNPVLFPAALFSELAALQPHQSGNAVDRKSVV